MKRLSITEQIQQRLRTSYGPDANLDGLVVFETVALTTLPIRKVGGIFQGARNSLSLLSEIGAAINAESAPLRLEHDGDDKPFGRAFYCEMVGDELRSLFAVDGVNHPDVVTKLDNGTIDQVSVNFAPKRITCSGCGFDFKAPGNELSLWTLTCDEGHTIGQDGVFAHIDGLLQFFELSLVGIGGAQGARIVGPSDAQLLRNEQFRLAASANPNLFAVALSPTLKDPSSTMNEAQMAQFSAAVAGQATAQAALTAMTAERDTAQAALTAAQAEVTTLTARVTELTAAGAASEANAQAAAAALAAMQDEARTILTALGKPTDAIPEDLTAVMALIKENRAAFAAAVPVNGKSQGTETDTSTKTPARSTAAFRAPK